MLDLGWTELLLIGIVALIVVGPKDLPGMFRAVGNFVGKAKKMGREFSRAMNDAADDTGVRDVSDSLRKASNPLGSAMDEVKKASKDFTQTTMAGPKKKELDPERKAQADKIREYSTKVGQERLDREKAEAAADTAGGSDPATDAASEPAPEQAAEPASDTDKTGDKA